MTWTEIIKASDARVIKDREEELSLFRAARAGDAKAKDTLVKSMWPLVLKMSRRFREDEDAISAGMTGVVIAYEKFDPSRGNRFSTVAYTWIFQQIMEWYNRSRYVLFAPMNILGDSGYRKRHGIGDDFMPGVKTLEACQVFNESEQAKYEELTVKQVDDPADLAERNEKIATVRKFVSELRPLDRGFMENYLRGVGIKKCGECAPNYNTVIKSRVFKRIKEELAWIVT
jgi:RNA polymerase sigma factor (sigma-70 family)